MNQNAKIAGVESPIHKHDCGSCLFLGTFERHDLYFCDKVIGGPTLIARWGSEGPDYTSGVEFAVGAEKRCRENSKDLNRTIRAIRVAYLIALDQRLPLRR